MVEVRVEGPAVPRSEEVLSPVRRLVEQVAPADDLPDFRTLPAHELFDR